MTLIAIAWLSPPPPTPSPDSREPRSDGNEIVICQLHPSKPPGKTDKSGGGKEAKVEGGGGRLALHCGSAANKAIED